MNKLYDINNMTAQEVFDASVEHIYEQGVQSVDCEGQCNYRTASGLMCAAGIFIPEEKYEESFEGQSWLQVAESFGSDGSHALLVVALQRAHDFDLKCGWLAWEREITKIAAEHKLTFNKDRSGRTE